MITNKKKIKGFTLAEILITLVIIGTVASLTIPSIIIKYQKKQTVAKLKKTYEQLFSAYNLSVMENGPIKNWQFGRTQDQSLSKQFIEKYLEPYLNVAEKKSKKLYLADGVTVSLDKYLRESTVRIYFDINGDKAPNRLGRDIFCVEFGKDVKFGFPGIKYSRQGIIINSHGCSHDVSGDKYMYCGALIQKDGWEIKNDYPW